MIASRRPRVCRDTAFEHLVWNKLRWKAGEYGSSSHAPPTPVMVCSRMRAMRGITGAHASVPRPVHNIANAV